MKRLATLLIFATTPAIAHVGHLGEVAGHGHLIAAGALGAAALAAWLAAKGKGKKADAEPEEDSDTGAEPAEA